jgi:hypothetical protein
MRHAAVPGFAFSSFTHWACGSEPEIEASAVVGVGLGVWQGGWAHGRAVAAPALPTEAFVARSAMIEAKTAKERIGRVE